MAPADLTVHDMTVQNTNRFALGGGVNPLTRVTYWVGRHGPFTLEYPTADATTERIQTDIDKQVSQLKVLTSGAQGS